MSSGLVVTAVWESEVTVIESAIGGHTQWSHFSEVNGYYGF